MTAIATSTLSFSTTIPTLLRVAGGLKRLGVGGHDIIRFDGSNGTVAYTVKHADSYVRLAMESVVDTSGYLEVAAERFLAVCDDFPSYMKDVKQPIIVKVEGDTVIFWDPIHRIRRGLIHLSSAKHPEVTSVERFSIDSNTLSDILKRVSFAQAPEAKISIGSICFRLAAGKSDGSGARVLDLEVCATDGYRLALYEPYMGSGDDGYHYSIAAGNDNPVEFLIPATVLKGFLLLIDNPTPISFGQAANGMVRIAAAGESSFVPVAAEIFLDNAWRGVFPNFRQIIPSYCEHEVTMKIEDLRAVMKGWDKKVTVMHMNFNVDAVSGKGCVEIYSKAAGKDGPDVIALVTNLLCESLPNGDGTALKIAFNPEFLFDMVRALPIRKGHVTFRMNGSLTPVVIKHTAATYLLMPLNSI